MYSITEWLKVAIDFFVFSGGGGRVLVTCYFQYLSQFNSSKIYFESVFVQTTITQVLGAFSTD